MNEKPAATLSVAIVACNEAEFIGRVIKSVEWADEIILVDSGSTDETVSIAKSYGAKICHEPWKGYGAQVNSALSKCTCDWILNLDADEVVSDALAVEIRHLLQAGPALQAYRVPRSNLVFGRWMRHGGLYPDHKLRLFRRGTAALREDTEPHATPKWSGPTGALKHPIQHYQYPTLSQYLEHMNRYSSASVPLVLRKGRTGRSLPAFLINAVLNPVFTFLYNYILRLGFLDGREGFIFHLNHSAYVHWKYAKAWMAVRDAPNK